MSLTSWRRLGLAYVCLCLVLLVPPAEAKRAPSPDEIDNCHGTTVQWSYDMNAADGPSHWGSLCSEWGACSEGTLQSPVDVLTHTLTPVATSSPLTENYTETLLVNITNSGHTILIDALSPSPSSSSSASNRSINCLFGGPLSGNYVLEQLLFHTPAEHRIDGQSFPVELQLIHRHEQQNNSVVIVSILFQLVDDSGGGSGSSSSSNSNEFLNKLFAAFKKIPSVGNHTTATLPLSSLMPANKYYYHYVGSLSAPPCSEGVEWMILESPLNITAAQLASLTTRTHNSSRPLQRLGSRELFQRFAVAKSPSFLTDVGQGIGASIAIVAALVAVVGGGILVQNACSKRLKKAKLKKRLQLHQLSQQTHMDTINARYRHQHSLHRSLSSSSTSSTSSTLSIGGREAHIHGRPDQAQAQAQQMQMRSGVSPMMASFAPPAPNEEGVIVKPSPSTSTLPAHEATMRFATNSRRSSRNNSRNNSQKRSSRHKELESSSFLSTSAAASVTASSSSSSSSSTLPRSPSQAYFSEISSTLREAFHHHQPHSLSHSHSHSQPHSHHQPHSLSHSQPHHHGHNEDGEVVANPFASPPPLSSATVFVASHEYEPQAYVGDEVYDDDDNPFLHPSAVPSTSTSTIPSSLHLSHSHTQSPSPAVPHMVMAELDSVLTSPAPSSYDEDSYVDVDEEAAELDTDTEQGHAHAAPAQAHITMTAPSTPSLPSAASSYSASSSPSLHPHPHPSSSSSSSSPSSSTLSSMRPLASSSFSSSSSSSSTLSSMRPLASSHDEPCDVEQGLEEGQEVDVEVEVVEEEEEESANPFEGAEVVVEVEEESEPVRGRSEGS